MRRKVSANGTELPCAFWTEMGSLVARVLQVAENTGRE